MEFYDWQDTFSYSSARWVMVISARRYGKTYGLRKQCVKDYIKRGRRFVEVCRHKTEVPIIGEAYFSRLQENKEFPDREFKFEKNQLFIRKVSKENEKPWEVIGYVLALTDEQMLKRLTFTKVKRFVFDEGLIEHKDRYKRYLPREFERLKGLCMSVTGETPENPSDAVVYILGNAVDLTAPHFEELGVKKLPGYGKHLYHSPIGDVLLDYVEPLYFDEFAKNTTFGKAMAASSEGEKLLKNVFDGSNMDYVEAKPKHAKFWRGYRFSGNTFGLWFTDSLCYVTSRTPNGARLRVFTLEDDTINYDIIRRSGDDAKTIRRLMLYKYFRYDSPQTREKFLDMITQLSFI